MRPYHWLLSAGIAVLGVGGSLSWIAGDWAEPGKLVPDQSTVIWRGPEQVSPRPAKVRFTLSNTGGKPVRIIAAEAGCGCTKPTVHPKVVPPGGQGYVDVEAKYFPVGERKVGIALTTDSAATPRIELFLHLIGGSRPPFLLKVVGNLSFLGEFAPTDTREFRVCTVEPPTRTKAPRFEGLPPFLRVEPAGMTETPYVLPGTIERIYTYKVSFSSRPPEGVYHGEFEVVDPWDDERRRSVSVLSELTPPIRVVPPLVVLKAGADGSGETHFLIESREPLDGLRAEPVAGDDGLLALSGPDITENSRAAMFHVRLKPDAAPREQTETGIVITCRPDHHLVVPIILQREARP